MEQQASAVHRSGPALLAVLLQRLPPGALGGCGSWSGRARFLFDAILADAGIQTVLTGVRMPRMNAVMERWVQTCRRELLDRTPIRNQWHLLHALRGLETFCNEHRPHQGIGNARPLRPLPPPIRGGPPEGTATATSGRNPQ
ncbi:integrase core domain-containing protein [Actinomadura adrarensis]|uniref:Integrase core domain-containing protein n=1 Tax=Actinomadura adrarensis TaxID=1819600 RepID=A0ABW3CKG7_9ACTN